MKKWSLLVATLLLMGATATTFTSCVDTDEPEGILEMRKAKAEYIRALAAVENAKIAYQQAAAQTEQANVDLLKAKAEAEKAQAEIAKAQAQSAIIQAEAAAKAAEIVAEGQKALDEAKAEIAKAEAAKILAEAADEEARTQQLIAENQIKLKEYEAKLQVVLQNEETNLVKAKAQYEAALKDIAAMELVLSPKESAVLAAAKLAYTTAEGQLATAYGKVIKAQKALLKAVYGDEDDYETLQKNLADAQAELAAMNQVVADLEALSNSMTITDFEKQRDALKKKYGYTTADSYDPSAIVTLSGTYLASYDSLTVLIKQAQADNVALEDAWKDAQKATQKATQGVSDAKAKKYTVPEVKIEVTDGQVVKMLGSNITEKDGKNYLIADEMKDQTVEQLKAGVTTKTKLDNWKKALTPSTDGEDKAVVDCNLDQAKKDVTDLTKKYDEAVELFVKMHTQEHTGVAAAEVPTTDFTKAIDAYNKIITEKLQPAVKTYNQKYDELVAKTTEVKTKLATDKETELIEAKKLDVASTEIVAALSANGVTGYSATKHNTIKKIETLIDSEIEDATANKKAKKDLNDGIVKAWKGQKVEDVEKAESNAKKDAAKYAEDNYQSNDDWKKADKAFTEAKDALAKLENDEINSSDAKKNAYKQVVAAVDDLDAAAWKLAQVRTKDAKKVDADVLTGVKTKYANGAETKEGELKGESTATQWTVNEMAWDKDAKAYKATGHKIIVRSTASDANAKAIAAFELDKGEAVNKWKLASVAAFGVVRHSVVDVTPDMTSTSQVHDENGNPTTISGALAALLAAQEKVAKYDMQLGNNEAATALLATINTKINEVDAIKTAAEQAIKDAEQAEKDAKAAEKTAKETYEATYSGFVKEQNAIMKTMGYEGSVLSALESAIAAYYNSTYVEYTDEKGDLQRVKVKSVEDLKAWAKSQAKNYTKKAGKIEKQQEKIADYEKVVKRLEENGYSHTDKDGVLHDYIVADKQYAVELAQAEYDYIKSEFENAQANLAKVIEALGNGVAGVAGITEGTGSTGAQGGSSSYTGITSSGTSTNITL